MTEEKKEIEIVAGQNPYDNVHSLTTNIGFTRSSDIKYEVYAFRPVLVDSLEVVEAQLKEHYNATLQDAIDGFVKKVCGSPAYKLQFNDDGSLKPEGHARMQKAMDGYRLGQRATNGVTQKVKIAEHDELTATATALNMTVAELIAMAKDLKDEPEEEDEVNSDENDDDE